MRRIMVCDPIILIGPMVVHLCERQKELYATLSVHGPQQYASSDLEDFKEPTQFPAGVEVRKYFALACLWRPPSSLFVLLPHR